VVDQARVEIELLGAASARQIEIAQQCQALYGGRLETAQAFRLARTCDAR
jgi:hypothetical protein